MNGSTAALAVSDRGSGGKRLHFVVQNRRLCGTERLDLRYKTAVLETFHTSKRIFAYKQKTFRLQAKGLAATSKNHQSETVLVEIKIPHTAWAMCGNYLLWMFLCGLFEEVLHSLVGNHLLIEDVGTRLRAANHLNHFRVSATILRTFVEGSNGFLCHSSFLTFNVINLSPFT